MAITVLDASVVIAVRDPADALHARAVAAFRTFNADEFVLPASVYAEVLVGPIRNGPPAVNSLEEFISDFGMQIAPLTADVATRAAVLRATNPSLRLPDNFAGRQALWWARFHGCDAVLELVGGSRVPRHAELPQ